MKKRTIEERIDALEAILILPEKPQHLDTLGGRLKTIRQGMGVSLETLGRKCGVTRSTLSRMERDVGLVDAITLYKVSRALGVTMDYLWTGSPPNSGGEGK